MPIIPLRPLLEASSRYGFAHGAFNVNTAAQAQAVIEVHEMFRSAAILQGADLANAFMGGRADFKNGTVEDKKLGAARIMTAVQNASRGADIPVVMHLDHGHDIASVQAAMDGGYTSIMIDGSTLPFDENVALTREVVKLAHARGVTVEGELGVLAGVEDDVFSASSTYTNPMKVCEFFKKTRVDCLAISYGTKHGAGKGAHVKLRREIAIAATENLRHEGIFGVLVSHGSSTVPQYIVEEINALGGDIRDAHGIPIEELKAAIPCGIGKINVDTDIRLAITRNIREFFSRNPAMRDSPCIGPIWERMEQNKGEFDPRVYLVPVMTPLITGGAIEDEGLKQIVEQIKRGVREAVGALIVQFGSYGYAGRIQPVSLEQMADRYKKEGL